MNALTQAIFSTLVADSTLTGMVAAYAGGPAIITADPVPYDVPRPYVVTAQPLHDEPFDGKNVTLGHTIRQDLRVVADATGSSQLIDAIAERIRALLHRQSLTVTGYTMIVADVSGPVAAPSDPRIMMLVLTVRFVLV
jgi:uncharacterized protein DUF3168